jgi:sulfide:quinone oxidoreductase
VQFIHGEATKIDPTSQRVETSEGAHDYDYLVIATGYVNDFDVVTGLGPGGNALLDHAPGRGDRRRRGMGALPQ